MRSAHAIAVLVHDLLAIFLAKGGLL